MLLNLETGVLVPAACHRLSCPVCIVILALRLGAAIGMARPDQHVLLTQAGSDWPTTRRRVNLFRQNLRRLGVQSEDVFHVEPNPRATGTHVHMWRWGDPLDSQHAADAASRAGMGSFTSVTTRNQPPGESLAYGLKSVIDQGPAVGSLPPESQRYLAANGNRLCHATRAFWRDERGQRLAGVREATRVASRARSRGGTWVMTRTASA